MQEHTHETLIIRPSFTYHFSELPSVELWLRTTVVHNTARNDIFPSSH